MSITIAPGFTPGLGEERMPTLTTSIGLQNIPDDAKAVQIQPIGAMVRARFSGASVTAGGVGLEIADGMIYQCTSELSNVRLIQDGGTAYVNLVYTG